MSLSIKEKKLDAQIKKMEAFEKRYIRQLLKNPKDPTVVKIRTKNFNIKSKREKELGTWADFSNMSINLQDNLRDLCGEAYKATKNPPSKLDKLIAKIERQISDYNKLVEMNTGGRLSVIKQSQDYIDRLQIYLAKLKK